MPGPIVPLSLMSKTSKVGKALASAAKPVTDSLCTSESLLSKRIEAIERLGGLQFIINGYIVTGEAEENIEEVFDELKRFYLQSRSFFNRKVSHLLSKYMKVCKDAYAGKVKVNERELEKIMENLEFEFRCSVSPLPSHVWLRLVRYKLAPVVVIVVLVLLVLFFKKDIRQFLGMNVNRALATAVQLYRLGPMTLERLLPRKSGMSMSWRGKAADSLIAPCAIFERTLMNSSARSSHVHE